MFFIYKKKWISTLSFNEQFRNYVSWHRYDGSFRENEALPCIMQLLPTMLPKRLIVLLFYHTRVMAKFSYRGNNFGYRLLEHHGCFFPVTMKIPPKPTVRVITRINLWQLYEQSTPQFRCVCQRTYWLFFKTCLSHIYIPLLIYNKLTTTRWKKILNVNNNISACCGEWFLMKMVTKS